MKESLRNKCDLFAENYNEFKTKFKWNYTTSSKLGALLYTMEDRMADAEAVKRCKDMIKEKTGVFSQFRETTYFMTAVILSLKEAPEDILDGTLEVYDSMKMQGFYSSPYLVLAALSIALQAEKYDYKKVIITAKNYYDSMKKVHRFITSSDDYGFAAMLAMTEKPVDQAIAEMEKCYRLLKEKYAYSNAVQSLSHVLTFSDEDASVKCYRLIDLYEAMAERGCKFGSGMELSFLGVVSLLDEDINKLAQEIAEVNSYLKEKKGFGSWSISSKERVMYAAALVSDDYLSTVKKDTMKLAMANNITGILLAQQMALIAASSGAAAAAATTST